MAKVRTKPVNGTAPMRLTARGRAALALVLVATGLTLSLATGAVSVAGTTASTVPARYVTVEGGQTLWEIAGEVAPSADRREVVAQLRELNALPSSAVRAGQQLAVPGPG